MSYDNHKKSDYISILNQIKKDGKGDSINVNDKVLIIDGLNTFIRAHSVNPAVNEDGIHVGGLAGFLKSIKYLYTGSNRDSIESLWRSCSDSIDIQLRFFTISYRMSIGIQYIASAGGNGLRSGRACYMLNLYRDSLVIL